MSTTITKATKNMTDIYVVFRFFIAKIVRIYDYIVSVLFAKKSLPPPPRQETVLDKIAQYIQKTKTEFAAKIKVADNDTHYKNANADIHFYSKTGFEKCIIDSDNDLEKIWRTRILMENTPRGNVIMFYDSYKMGFAYYSDANNISYSMLNAVAMKYVLRYRCLDFYMDNEPFYGTEEFTSPLIYIHAAKPEKSKEEKPKNKEFTDLLKSAPFIKHKKTENQKIQDTNNHDKKTPQKEYSRNRFICMGKIANFSFLQKTIVPNKLNGFTSPLLDNLTAETNLNKSVLNYAKYKEMQHNK
jgi:hypothetical protein